ncbi:MAG: MBL fold metallo-hydrolase [Syntrophaceae bacterium]|jgi:hydroxyacylglutathione hydrolase|nr:MBL fold metallo-hydrolase [Syntrophaceae bacterium]
MIIKVLEGNTLAANCYVVASEATRRGMIIDPGVKAERISEAMRELNISISLVALTHVHIDHFSALDKVKNTTKAPLAVFDASTINVSPEPHRLIKKTSFVPFALPIKPDILLKDGETIDIDDLHFSVLYTPGHSSDSVSFWGHGVVFSGDTLFRRGIGVTLPGLYPGHDHAQLKESIHAKLMTLPDDTIVFPGHGAPTTIGEERLLNLALRR